MRFLLVGGSNCVIREGYGAVLTATVPGSWTNRSLGNSPSLRGIDHLLSHPQEVREAERIVFEYALNDQIFESSNTLDPPSHALALRALLADPAIAARLVFVLLVGRGPSGRAASGHSFVLDHYRGLAAEHGVPVIDLIPRILEATARHGSAAVFKDNDHFTEMMVGSLVEATAAGLAALPKAGEAHAVARTADPHAPRLVRLDPLAAGGAGGVSVEVFRSRLLTSEMMQLRTGDAIELTSPGGLLLGCYALCSHDAGMLRLTIGERDIVKTMRHGFPYDKPFVALRHLSSPVPTRPGERIMLRLVDGLADVPNAQLDPTLAQVANKRGGELAVGTLLFLQQAPARPPAADSSSMAATLRHLQPEPAKFDRARTVGRYERAPDETGGRLAEGGLRLQGQHKGPMAGLPLVSIVTISLNAAATIGQTIASVLRQTYANVEYIVVDGASTDGTLDVIRSYQQAIDYFVSEPDRGLYAAMNKAIGLASGDYVLVLNADDWYADDAVEALVAARSYSGCDVVSALAQYVDAAGRPVQQMRSMPFDAGLRLRMALRHETMLVPASIYERFGAYDESYRVIADFDFTRKLFEAGVTHYEVPRALLFFRNTGVSSTALDKLAADRARLLAEQFPELSQGDLDLMATMSKLRPELVEPLARRHLGSDKLVEALRAYQVDQAGRVDAPAWSRQPVDWSAIHALQGKPRVSVILPVYNAAGTLPTALDSVLAQTVTDLEVICLNDVTPDGSQTIIDDYVRRDPRVRSLVNERNIGHGATRNRGVRASRGIYVFHLDPDDTLPPKALEHLLDAAEKHGSDMVKGDYLREQMLHGAGRGDGGRFSILSDGKAVINTNLRDCPQLLRTTEGHWSYLYRAGFARQVPYPTDLKMGQDSIFLVNALVRARTVSLIPELVYHYGANPLSAMNTFTFRKFADGLEWRRRAWHVLRDRGYRAIGDRLLLSYWSDAFFSRLGATASIEQLRGFMAALGEALRQAGAKKPGEGSSALVRALFEKVLAGDEDGAVALLHKSGAGEPSRHSIGEAVAGPVGAGRSSDDAVGATPRPLRVATFCSMDQGGAATGSHRRIEALRRRGVDATLHSLVTKSGKDYVHRVQALQDGMVARNGDEVWQEVRRRAIQPAVQLEGYRAQELFSLARSVVDFRKLKPVFDQADVVHFHWVVGMLDLENVECLADKPMVWTLADMNAFTGGCHYAEGCEAYRGDCRSCTLLGGSDLANESWARKKEAYRKLRRLHIVCPSQWIADHVARSSLLGDKPVHVIPNAFPVDRLMPVNKTVARIQLGLPVEKRLLLFGADSVTNKRKGREFLELALQRIAKRDKKGVEVVLFGNGSMDLPLPVHRLGHINTEDRLSLAYSAADAFLFPSMEDNAPLTVGESLLCGTPVVAFPVGNVPELLRHEDTGYIARHRDAMDLVRGVDWALEADPASALRRSLRCRLSAAAFHDPLVAADRHLQVYKEAMSDA
jgi:glycosyltransferase involved in cell wall biosynthesis